jgi:hypothetical protein
MVALRRVRYLRARSAWESGFWEGGLPRGLVEAAVTEIGVCFSVTGFS